MLVFGAEEDFETLDSTQDSLPDNNIGGTLTLVPGSQGDSNV